MGGGLRWGAGLAAVAATAITVAACSPNDPPGGDGRLSIATGGSGGVYQVYGGGLADVLSEKLPDNPTTAETTSASVDNLLLVANGDSDIAFTLADTAVDAVRGTDVFERPLPIRSLGTIYLTYTQVVAKDDSGIDSIEDMNGKTVSVGSPGSGAEIMGLRLLRAAGLDPDEDIHKRGLGVGESAQAIRDGSIDAFFWTGGVPTAAIVDLSTTDDVHLIPTDRYVPELNKRFGGAYEVAEVEDGEYKGVPGAKTVGIQNMLMVNEAMDDDLAYSITKALYANKAKLSAIVPSAKGLDPKKGRELIEPVKMHPGAERFYMEAG
jgi:TRAP transporter TAXI family solute receptor